MISYSKALKQASELEQTKRHPLLLRVGWHFLGFNSNRNRAYYANLDLIPEVRTFSQSEALYLTIVARNLLTSLKDSGLPIELPANWWAEAMLNRRVIQEAAAGHRFQRAAINAALASMLGEWERAL